MSYIYLESQDIIKMTGTRFYKRGLDYYNKGRVNQLSYNSSIQSWSATVKGAENYQVRIFVFEDDDLEATCHCPAYETHYTCKHIAAVLLAISQPNTQKQDPVEKRTDTDPFPLRMIEAFSPHNAKKTKADTPLLIHYHIKETKQPVGQDLLYNVSLKAGESNVYIIKDIKQFIESVIDQNDYSITQNLHYHPSQHVINNVDLQLIRLLQEAIVHAHLYGGEYTTYSKRDILIPPFLIDSFLDSVQYQSFDLTKEDGTVWSSITLQSESPQIPIRINESDNRDFEIDFSDLFDYQFLTHYHYLVDQNHFYKLSNEQSQSLKQIRDILPYRQKKSYQIGRHNMTQFLSFVTPKLETLGELTYSDAASRAILSDELQVELYIEENKQALTASVDFVYGDKRFGPNQTRSGSDAVVKRDISTENALIDRLKSAGFKWIHGRFHLFQVEAIYTFVHDVLPGLMNDCTVYLSESVENLQLDQEPTLKSSVSVNNETGMLSIDFDIDGISHDEVDELLKALIEKQQFYRTKKGPLIKLDDDSFEQFKELADRVKLKKQDIERNQLTLHGARSLEVNQVLTDQTEYTEAFSQLVEDIQQPEHVNYALPKSLNAELRDYQMTGYQWFNVLAKYNLGGILADEMGLGKTVQAISFILSEKQKENHLPALIVAPASLTFNWKKEFEKFAPTLSTDVISGSKNERRKKLSQDPLPDVWITSYPSLRQDIELYQNQLFDQFILDEAQVIKNHLTQTAKATRKITAKQRFALSGTPIENRLDELWSIFETISPGFLGPKQAFIKEDINDVKLRTRPFILRRLKTDVLPDLPERIEFEQYAELTKEQKQLYIGYLNRIEQQINEVIESDQFEKGKLEILAGLTRLRQICCHPSLFVENYEGESGKLNLLMTMIDQLREQNRRVLIFSQFSSMLQIIDQQLKDDHISSFYLDGQTPSEKRVQMAEAFNSGEKEIFLISLKAGGTGLNLTGADTVILFDLWWNPAVEAQAAGRAHRIGQQNKVEVIRLITEGTIEEKIFNLQQKKRELVDEILEPGETLLSSLSKDELKELIQLNIDE
ncbi:Superfamily II DNA or RNA helicase, SNF2 family [Pelagirhabdus alkalitolerans]|uniref:Superfamily II DNA or RNA helicase, SNF2 family n=1 Tax=Pelagirhabdus alkalitolerans TaxID=1612202 RepID=A0A1G6MTH2_9BACI|nr:DEAD/DEAH box helicase [Pelagirhabdus alkalitolerans]SDC58850.1 Superfamily II DNA or RNA helicase, SNF2 family [Pelagirhabdus alkalitolerans]